MSSPESQQAYSQGYHVGYQHGFQAAQQQLAQGGGGMPPGGSNYPVTLVAQYPEQSSRLLMFFRLFKWFLLIPHIFCLYALMIGFFFVNLAAWWVVLFTGRYPRGMWEYGVGVLRWQNRIAAYFLGITDEYPPFSLS